MRGLVMIGLRLHGTGRMRLRNSSPQLTSAQRPKRLHLTDANMADSLSEFISTASYKMRERRHRNY